MKVLWVCNGPLTVIAKTLGMSNGIGWIDGAYNGLANNSDITVEVCFPSRGISQVTAGTVEGLTYYQFPLSPKEPHIYWKPYKQYLQEIIAKSNPDIIHLWGTEFSYCLAAAQCIPSEKLVIHIQGLCSYISRHYYAHLPERVVLRRTFRDILRRDSIPEQKQKYEQRGIYEQQAIRKAGHIIGRTEWDRACTHEINPKAQYHSCNETLRAIFHGKKWKYATCEKHSIFMSHVYCPIKGFHQVLEAMPEILKYYPDAVVYCTDDSPLDIPLYRLDSYSMYSRELIRKYGLQEHIRFLGRLSAEEMLNRFLKSNVFILPSSIENSSNSLGEAMLLGVPCVCADVGGVKDFIRHRENGYLYQGDAPYMLSCYINDIFAQKDAVQPICEKARADAARIFNQAENAKRLIQIYQQIK